MADIEHKDYLTEDQVISRQRYCCISFAEPPSETEKNLETYVTNSFLKHLHENFNIIPKKKEQTVIIEPMEPVDTTEITKPTETTEPTEPTETTEPVDTTEPTEPTEPMESTESNIKFTQLFEEYIGYKKFNYTNLLEAYVEKHGNNICVRGVKVRGSYPSLDEARDKASNLQKIDKTFNVFVGQVGCWLPFNPINIEDVEPEYYEKRLNSLVRTNLLQKEHSKQAFENHKHKLMNHKNVR